MAASAAADTAGKDGGQKREAGDTSRRENWFLKPCARLSLIIDGMVGTTQELLFSYVWYGSPFFIQEWRVVIVCDIDFFLVGMYMVDGRKDGRIFLFVLWKLCFIAIAVRLLY